MINLKKMNTQSVWNTTFIYYSDATLQVENKKLWILMYSLSLDVVSRETLKEHKWNYV